MTLFRLDVVNARPFDLALDVPAFTLWRRGAEVGLMVDDVHAADVRRRLALHGVRSSAADDASIRPPALPRAVGVTIEPVRLAEGDLDLVAVRALSLAESTAAALRRPVRRWPLGRRRRSRCRALLRGRELVLEIRRTGWCRPETLRASRHALRPAVFDKGAAPSPIRIYGSDQRLTRWVTG